MRGEYLQGIVMASGAETSHTAILAQSFSSFNMSFIFHN
ncbi:PEP-utilizing enzyme [Providencia huaxiensis]